MTFKEQLNLFSAVKFPLMLAIVCIHVQNNPAQMTFDYFYVKFWAEAVGRIGVPLFFFISGLMFFCNVENNKSLSYFISHSWNGKMKRRLHSLLIPYVVWNLIAFLFFYIKGDVGFTFGNLIHSFWDLKKDGYWFFPVNGVFWFIRDLFIVATCSPLIYFFISRLGKTLSGGGICTLIILFIIINTQYRLGSLVETLILFTIGAVVGLNRMNVIDFMIKWRSVALALFIALSIFHIITLSSMYSYILEHLLVVIGSVAFVGIFYKTPVVVSGGINLQSLSMFVFASHAILRFVAFIILRKMDIDIMWLDYSLRFIFTVGLCVVAYILGSKICPKLLHLSIGGR